MKGVTLDTVFGQTLAIYLKPIQGLFDDPSVSEILINGAQEVYVERKGRLYKTDARFDHEDHVMALAKNIAQYVGRSLSEETPLLDARLPGGSRVHVTLPPISRKGICIAVRKFFQEALTIAKLIEFGSLTQAAADFLDACVKVEQNVIVAGGTGSGKTSMLNAMSALIPDDQRIIVIEDSTELQLQQPHLLYYETRPADRAGRGEITMRQLFRSAMRMRPDRVIIGEVRGGECIDMIQAMTSGHKGSMSTVHASSPRETLSRIETLALMGGLDIPLWALRSQIGMALDVLVQVTRHTDGSRKVSSICEVTGTDKDNEYMVRELFVWKGLGKDQQGRVLGQLEPSGLLPTFAEHIKLAGVRFPREMIDAARARKAELERRRADRDGGPRDSA